jgi:hypothetical protein
MWQDLAIYPYPIELPILIDLGFDTHHTNTQMEIQKTEVQQQ